MPVAVVAVLLGILAVVVVALGLQALVAWGRAVRRDRAFWDEFMSVGEGHEERWVVWGFLVLLTIVMVAAALSDA